MTVLRGSGRPPEYRLPNGTRVPSWSSIAGNRKTGIEGLLVWANRLGREGKNHRDVRDEAASAGTVAHAMVENSIHGRDPMEGVLEVEPAILASARKGFEAFLAWQAGQVIEYINTEVPLVSEKYAYGGTPDAVARMGTGKAFAVLDWKTSNAVYGDYLIQLAAYRNLVEEHHHESVTECHLLRFGKEHGDFHHHSYPPSAVGIGWAAFVRLRELYDLDKQLGKLAK